MLLSALLHRSSIALRRVVLLFAFCAAAVAVRAVEASPFVNLDFEQANVIPTGGHSIDAAAAFPGWTARIAGEPLSSVYYDYDGAGEAFVALYDREAFDLGIPLLQGHYMALLATRIGHPDESASLVQVGDISVESRSIRIVSSFVRGPPMTIINGTLIPMVLVGHFDNGTEYVGDITAFAGMGNVELMFQSAPPTWHRGLGRYPLLILSDSRATSWRRHDDCHEYYVGPTRNGTSGSPPAPPRG